MQNIKQTLCMAYLEHENIGALEVFCTTDGVCKCRFTNLSNFESELLGQEECFDTKAIDILATALRQINSFLSGEPTNFTVPLDWKGISPFAREVYQATMQIPFGKVRTYGEIAHAIQKPHACRAVGQALSANPMVLIIPCHRVIASNGNLQGFSAPTGLAIKSWLLQHEGHHVQENHLIC